MRPSRRAGSTRRGRRSCRGGSNLLRVPQACHRIGSSDGARWQGMQPSRRRCDCTERGAVGVGRVLPQTSGRPQLSARRTALRGTGAKKTHLRLQGSSTAGTTTVRANGALLPPNGLAAHLPPAPSAPATPEQKQCRNGSAPGIGTPAASCSSFLDGGRACYPCRPPSASRGNRIHFCAIDGEPWFSG
jgi:hypothetical protein